MKAKVAWCKYCYTTHDKWWPVEGKPYWTCGICLHTSAEDFMDKVKVFFYDSVDIETGEFYSLEEAYEHDFVEIEADQLQPVDPCSVIIYYSGHWTEEKEEDVKAKILSLGTGGVGSLVAGEEGEVRSAR